MNIKNDIESVTDLFLFYKFVYICDKCKTNYGSDKKENSKHICPVCEGKKV